jgi:hypothetical protein
MGRAIKKARSKLRHHKNQDSIASAGYPLAVVEGHAEDVSLSSGPVEMRYQGHPRTPSKSHYPIEYNRFTSWHGICHYQMVSFCPFYGVGLYRGRTIILTVEEE